ncbi:UDP-N-acetylmuramate dehydrogenase [Eubacterium nodatum ATCC 33099]|nr:UDP-N-acetylmuramate dehydrogenase [Eubacterium nodatum ATCC 33099]
MKIIKDVEMKDYTSFKAGGKANKMVICEREDEVIETLREIKEKNEKYIMLGNGSNTLVKDSGFSGTVIKLGDSFSKIIRTGNNLVCGGNTLMSVVAKYALREGLTGFEFASGIPGSIGGAFFMNAGAYGGEIKDIAKSAKIISRDTLELKEVGLSDMGLSYRHSAFQENGDIILSVELSLEEGNKSEIESTMKDLAKKRNSKQPVQFPSAGSFFKRPEGHFAGKLIQDSGMKGVSVGGAQVSELHSGFIVNKGNATATDIIQLMELVQKKVYEKFGVSLEPEVRIIGD